MKQHITPVVDGTYQRQSFVKLMQHAWTRSSFYRAFYSKHGIRERDLADISIHDLPFLSKISLMENFDQAVTDTRLSRKALEKWIHENPDPGAHYLQEFVVVNTSGSTGTLGIFVHDKKAWKIADAAMAARLPMPENYPNGRTKAAFYLAAHGHFAGVTTASSMHPDVYETVILSLLERRDRTVSRLNAFQPDRLYGYSSTITELAQLSLVGDLRIRPKSVFVAGDKLTAPMEEMIYDAWHVPVYVTYGTSESKYVAVRGTSDRELRVVEELNIVEVLDDRNQPVKPGQAGRVVLTNLYNWTLPIIRYELGDYVVPGKTDGDSFCVTIQDIKGRVNDALPVLLDDGGTDTIHPIILSEFHVPNLECVQFEYEEPGRVQIAYVASANIDELVRQKFRELLEAKRATRTGFTVCRVPEISNDPKTGKLKLVKTSTKLPLRSE